MVLVGPEDVEILEPADLPVETAAPRVQIEQVLGEGIHVERTQRPQFRFVGEIVFERAVGCSRRRVDEALRRLLRPLREIARVLVVVAHEIVAVVFGRRRASAEVKDGADAAEVVAVGNAAFEIVGVEIVGKPERDQVAPLLGAVQAVDDQNVVEPPPVERPNDGAANQAGAPGNDDRAAVEFEHIERPKSRDRQRESSG